jgi:hypothetical protein
MLNSNPNGMHLLNRRKDKIDWEMLGLNPNAIELLMTNKKN